MRQKKKKHFLLQSTKHSSLPQIVQYRNKRQTFFFLSKIQKRILSNRSECLVTKSTTFFLRQIKVLSVFQQCAHTVKCFFIATKNFLGCPLFFKQVFFLVTLFVAQQQIRPEIFKFFKDQQHKSSVFFIACHPAWCCEPVRACRPAELVFVEGEDQAWDV